MTKDEKDVLVDLIWCVRTVLEDLDWKGISRHRKSIREISERAENLVVSEKHFQGVWIRQCNGQTEVLDGTKVLATFKSYADAYQYYTWLMEGT